MNLNSKSATPPKRKEPTRVTQRPSSQSETHCRDRLYESKGLKPPNEGDSPRSQWNDPRIPCLTDARDVQDPEAKPSACELTHQSHSSATQLSWLQ